MTRINLLRAPSMLESNVGKSNFNKTASVLVFAGLLIVCSIAVGCSSEKPKTEISANQPGMTQPTTPVATIPASVPAAAAPEAAKPVRKKVVRKAPATLMYADKTSGISFEYPRKYSVKTGDAANQLVSAGPGPMSFVQPGGVAIAAVVVPESQYPKSDLALALFDVSVNKTLTAEQCGKFSETKPATETDGTNPASAQTAKLVIGDMELASSETRGRQGTREEASKYYHVFENGACYEFALKVATGVETDEGGKHVDREEVFKRLEKILATVKIGTVESEVTASAPAASTAGSPAQ